MQRLIEALTASLDPVSLTRRATEQILLFTPSASGAAISLRDPDADDRVVVVSAHGILGTLLGQTLPRANTLQDSAMVTKTRQVSQDVLIDERVPSQSKSLAARFGVRSWVAIPLIHNDVAIGVMTVVASEAHCFDPVTVEAIASMSSFVGALMRSQTELADLFDALHAQHADGRHRTAATTRFVATLLYPDHAVDDRRQHRLDHLFSEGCLRPVFQPIVELSTGRVVAVEGLARFPGAPERSVAQWFEAARRHGRNVDLELHAANAILDASRALPRDLPVTINFSPFTASDSAAQDLLLRANRPLSLELTEHEPFPDGLGAALEPLRANGIRVAVDDAGAGYASFLQILRIKPDTIKIDAEFTTAIETDPARRALTMAIVELAREIDAVTVAEAIETEEQLRAVTTMGVTHGQGYFLGRPAPVATCLDSLRTGKLRR